MLKQIDRHLTAHNDIVLLVARLLIAALFLIAGYNAFKSLARASATSGGSAFRCRRS